MTMITPSYLGETIEYSSLHACRSTLEDPTQRDPQRAVRRTTAHSMQVRQAGRASSRSVGIVRRHVSQIE